MLKKLRQKPLWVCKMGVYQKKNGKWYCEFRHGSIRKHLLCRGASNKKEAEQIENAFKYRLQQQVNGVIPKDLPNMTMGQLVNKELEYAQLNKKSYKTDESRAKVIKKFFGWNSLIKDIKPEKIEEFKNYLLSTGKSKATANRYLEQLSKSFNIAVDNEYLRKNPCKTVKKFPVRNTTVRYLTEDEEKHLFKVLPEYLKPIVITALNTGLRKSNILELTWEQINLEFGLIEVLENKGNKHIYIPVNDTMRELLEKLAENGATGYVFVNPETGENYKDIKKSWNTALAEAGIENFRFHDLRHTVGTRLASKNVPVNVIKEILAHSDIKTTMRYVHCTSGARRDALNLLDKETK